VNDVILDDDDLLKDRLLRSLHRDANGHLAANRQHHENAVDGTHNVAILYVYTHESRIYTLHEHYIYSAEPYSYKGWRLIVNDEIAKLVKASIKDFYGIYGWLTSTVHITPLRTGDMFIKIDSSGARGVRLTFDSRKDKREAHSKTAKAAVRR
jgi:hypothetical protein